MKSYKLYILIVIIYEIHNSYDVLKDSKWGLATHILWMYATLLLYENNHNILVSFS